MIRNSLTSIFSLTIVVLFSLSSFSQSPADYSDLWEKVETLSKNGKPRSAIEEVEKVCLLAEAEGNQPQVAKAVLKKLSLMATFEEDFELKGMQYLEQELLKAKSPLKEVLLSVKGELLWSYYEQNTYVIMERENLEEGRKEDFTTWSYRDFAEVAETCYLASINETLKQIPIKDWAPILNKGKDGKYRPTLYDFLAFRALDHFTNPQAHLNKSIHEFNLNSEDFLSDSKSFLTLELDDTNKNAAWFYLTIIQDLMGFHAEDQNPEVFIDADLIRLKYIYDNGSFDGKDKLYFDRLMEWFNTPGAPEIVAEAGMLAANMRYRQYEKGGCYLCETIDLCNQVIKRFPESESVIKAKELIGAVEAPSLALLIPERVASGRNELAQVSVKNLEKIYLRVVKLNDEDYPVMNYRDTRNQSRPELYYKRDVVEEWDYSFELPADYMEHSMEIALPALPYGFYGILVSEKPNFNIKGVLAYAEFQVSDMSIVIEQLVKDGNQIRINDLSSGKPLSDVNIFVYRTNYRTGSRLIHEGVTNESGFYPLEISGSYNDYAIIRNGRDRLVVPVRTHSYGDNQPKDLIDSWIFTDRAVYRPGQTVYYKTFLTRRSGEDVSVIKNAKVRLELLDINYQTRAEETKHTNEFGTLNGAFVIPNDIPTGNITIKTPYGQKSVRVEEYKRPTFEITFDEIEARANESDPFKVTGAIETYSGLPLEDVSVEYRITRSSYIPWRWWWRPFTDESKEIAFGTIKSDDDGKFELNFEASPRKEEYDFFGYTYTVNVTVTDKAGEMHEKNTSVNDAVKKIAVKTDLPGTVWKEGLEDISISIINHLDEIEKCSGEVKIEKLEVPKNTYRDRLWGNEADISVFDQTDFEMLFPLDYYEKPAVYAELKPYKTTLETYILNGESTLSSKDLNKWKPGIYRLTVTAVSGMDTAKLSKEFILLDANSNKPAENKIFAVYHKDKSYEPGENASILLSSSKQLEVTYILSDGKEILERKIIALNNSLERIEIPVLESYRGNVFVQLYANLNSRLYQKSITLNVPYSNKVLDVEFETFRDVTEPGSEEQWILKVSDYKDNPVQGEILITMYDRALDVFAPLSYRFTPFAARSSSVSVFGDLFGFNRNRYWNNNYYNGYQNIPRDYDRLFWTPYWNYGYGTMFYERSAMPITKSINEVEEIVILEYDMEDTEVLADDMSGLISMGEEDKSTNTASELRSDFSETAFFYPHLKTNDVGVVEVSFTAPQSVTGWKVLGLVHTKDLKSATFTKELVTRKEIMITPNMPRFVRQGDKLILQATINSMMEEEVSVETFLELFDPETEESLNHLINGFNRRIKNVDANGSVMAEWEVEIPFSLSSLGIRSFAKTAKHTDGEEHIIPVLSSQTLVIESLPISVDSSGSYEFTLENLVEKGGAANNFALTLEFTANPAWYAVQALPYLEESRSKSASAIFNRYYANALASYIANYNPQIKRIFDMWRNQSPEVLLSALEKNQELKTTLLQESPWLAEAKDETEQKRRIALLFDLNRISQQKSETWNMLTQMQNGNGSWSWYEGMRPSPYTTLSIVENSARLYYLGVEESVPYQIIQAAKYLDEKAKEEYEEILKRDDFEKGGYHISNFAISWLYARSLLGDNINSVMDEDWYEYYFSQIKENWTNFGLYQQSLAAIILYFNVEPEISEEIIESLKERAIYSDKLGMYWRELHSSPYWYSAPIPTMASLIEAFSLMGDNGGDVRQMKKWLLTQKQTNRWSSSIGTVHAIYALLLQGDEMLSGSNDIEISLGGDVVISKDETKEPGTGYIKKVWHGKEIEAAMGEIEVTTYEDRLSWGALHWQYYAPYSEIESAGNGLTINRKLYLKENTEQGPVLKEIKDENSVETGERIVVRMEVTADRDYSFVHLKDQRMAAFEPVETRSGYRYKNGAGFYLSVRDASVNYFFDHLRKGNYTFEYELFRVRTGTYNGGLSTIQCVYAPEFNAHSEGN